MSASRSGQGLPCLPRALPDGCPHSASGWQLQATAAWTHLTDVLPATQPTSLLLQPYRSQPFGPRTIDFLASAGPLFNASANQLQPTSVPQTCRIFSSLPQQGLQLVPHQPRPFRPTALDNNSGLGGHLVWFPLQAKYRGAYPSKHLLTPL